MPLKKRFLHADIRVYLPTGPRLYLGIGAGLVYAVVLYMFFFCMRETLRLLSVDDFYNAVILTDRENRFFNLFFAFLSLIFAQSVCFRIWLDRPRFIRGINRAAQIVNDQRFLNWGFFMWFARVATIYGLMFHMFRGSVCLDLFESHLAVFILILVVLFLQQWVWIIRMFGRMAYKWQMVSLVIMAATGFGLSKLDPVDSTGLDTLVRGKSIHYNYRLEPPQVNHTQAEFGAYISGQIILAYSREGGSLCIFMDNYRGDPALSSPDIPPSLIKCTMTELPAELAARKEYLQSSNRVWWDIDRFRVLADRDVPIGVVNEVKQELFDSGVRIVLNGVWAVWENETPSPSLMYYHAAIFGSFNPWLTSADIEENLKTLPNIIEVVQDKESIHLNGTAVSYDELKLLLPSMIDRDRNYTILYTVTDDTRYGDYIRARVAMRWAIKELNDLLVPGWEYTNWEKRIPANILELPADSMVRYEITHP